MYYLASNPSLRFKFTLRDSSFAATEKSGGLQLLDANSDKENEELLDKHLLNSRFASGDNNSTPKNSINRKLTRSSLQSEIQITDSNPRCSSSFASNGEVMAEFLSIGDSLAFAGKLHPQISFSSVIDPETKTYHNLVGLLIRELKCLRFDDAANSLHTEIRSAIEQVTQTFEASLAKIRSSRFKRKTKKDKTLEVKQDYVDLFEEDFDHTLSGRGLNRLRARLERPIFQKQLGEQPVQFRVYDERSNSPFFISGFLNLEIGQLPLVPEATSELERVKLTNSLDDLQQSFRLVSPPKIFHDDHRTVVNLHFSLKEELLSHTELYLHWGRYGEAKPVWVDEEINMRDIVKHEDGSFSVQKEIHPQKAGDYGLTAFAKSAGGKERIWVGRLGMSDTQFSISTHQLRKKTSASPVPLTQTLMFRGTLQQSLASYEQFLHNIYQLSRSNRLCDIQRGLYEITRAEPELQALTSKYYARANREIIEQTGLARRKREVSLAILRNLAIGEVVFIAPEGPHAIAGGLAQMIVGITATLSRAAVGVTLITPLHEEDQGNKHKSAEQLIAEGINILGQNVAINYMGQIVVPIGPVKKADTDAITIPPLNASVMVYSAECENIRVIFLRHKRFANRLYPTEWADQQLMRAVFLSRGALEVMLDSRFGVTPSVIVTNDWLAGLVQVYLQTDPTYRENPILKSCSTLHILHNCGLDYQGRIPCNQFGENLWPILGISGDHYFGLADKQTVNYLNLTRGAIFHTSGGIIAVSKPYADQLLTKEGGEGLDDLLKTKRKQLFGISNGIDASSIRQVFCQLGDHARFALGEPLAKARPTTVRFLQRIYSYKKATKSFIQSEYGLNIDSNAILISLIGRLTEQKGIQLLTGSIHGRSLLEEILVKHPNSQIIIGGPTSPGDPIGEAIVTELERLEKLYPGRVRGIISFIKHRDALAITLASDLFLMPSRFEPGGITQLEALSAGTLVVGRNVGGLAATLRDISYDDLQGDSFLFDRFTPAAMAEAVDRAFAVMANVELRAQLVIDAAKAEHDWSFRLPKYIALFQHVLGALQGGKQYRFLYDQASIVESIRPTHD